MSATAITARTVRRYDSNYGKDNERKRPVFVGDLNVGKSMVDTLLQA